MITIKIFLASSLTEFALQRMELEAFVDSLNKIYVERGIFFKLIVCEDLSNAMQLGRSQEIYNQEIRESQYFYVIIGRKAGRFTVEEFDVALSSFQEKDEPKLYIYFLELTEGEQPDQSVIDFRNRLENELEYFHKSYTHIDSIKLNLLTELVRDSRVGGNLTLENGEAHLDGTAVMSMANIPLYSKNKVVQRLLNEQKELEQEFIDLAGLGDGDAAQRLRLRNSARRNEIASRLHMMEMDVLGFCSRIEENRQLGKKLNWREKKALELADAGDYEAAKALLRDEQWQKEVSRAEETIDGAKEVIREYISGKRALIQMICLSGITKHNELEIMKIYEDICRLAVKHLVETDVLYDYAGFLWKQNKYTRAVEIGETLCSSLPLLSIPPQKQAGYYNLMGILYAKMSRFKKAESEYLKAKKIFEELANENPVAFLPDLAGICNNLGDLYSDTSRYKEAEKEYIRAKEIREKLAKENPATYLRDLANSCNNLGKLYRDTSRFREAETEYLRAQEIYEKLADKDSAANLLDLGRIYNNLGILYRDTSRYKEAETEYLLAKVIQKKLVEENPAAYLPDLALSCNNLGILYSNTNRYKEAETELLKAKEIYGELAEENPAVYLPDFAMSCINLGNLYLEISRYEEAETEYLRAKEIYEKLADGDSAANLSDLGMLYNNLGNLYKDTSRYEEAEKEYLKAKRICEKLAEENPEAYLPDLASLYNNMGILYSQTNRYKEAETEFIKAKEIYEKLAEKNPGVYLPDLAMSCNNLGSLYRDTSGYKEAETEYLRAKEIYYKCAEKEPSVYLQYWASVCKNLRQLYQKTDRPDDMKKEAALVEEFNACLEKLTGLKE